jgi:hypothetical protein
MVRGWDIVLLDKPPLIIDKKISNWTVLDSIWVFNKMCESFDFLSKTRIFSLPVCSALFFFFFDEGMFCSFSSRVTGVPTVFAPVPTAASLVGTILYCDQAAGVAQLVDPPHQALDADTLDEIAEVKTIVLAHSNLGDTAFLRLPIFSVQRKARLSLLTNVDLSFCQLSASPLVSSAICGVLLDPATTPNLLALNLVGNFRSHFGSPSIYCVGNSSNGAESFVTLLTDSWKGHPALMMLALDPWLVASHAPYQTVKLERISTKRAQRVQRRQAVTDPSENVSVTSRRHRLSTVVEMPTKFQLFDELVAAAEGSQLDARTSDTVAELQYKMVQLQLAEHRSRERNVRAEVNDRRMLVKETSQLVHAVVLAANRAVRHRQQRVAAMEELESEMRQMLVQKEDDGRRKLIVRFASVAR